MEILVKLILISGMLLGYSKYNTNNRNPLYPWDKFNSNAYIYVNNSTTDTLYIRASAIEIDNTVR